MVEVMLFKLRIFSLLLLSMAICRSAFSQDVRARIAGLESNEEYLSLLREDLMMQAREDSVGRCVETVRKQFRDDPDNRKAYADEILRLEEQIFSIRNTKGKLIDRINAIEQDWVLKRLSLTPTTGPGDLLAQPAAGMQPGVRNLVANRAFADNLPPSDYASLRKAQERERLAVDLVGRYADNYSVLLDLQERYATVKDEVEAASVLEKHKTLEGLNAALNDSLSAVWSYIFDNKTFAYGYLLDKLRCEELLSREIDHLSRTQRQIASLEGEYASDALVGYFLQKRALVHYELAIAETLGLGDARDSLAAEMAYLERVEYRLPKTVISERYFLDYEPLGFASPAKYNSRNPIPPCTVYEHGTIYRILLGTFRSKQPVSVFKGAYPIAYVQEGDGRYSYYAGGFATRDEADDARNQLVKKGFRRPQVVVWMDGTANNLTQGEAEGRTVSYRVEIVGTQSLSDQVRAAIAEHAGDCELSRVGQDAFAVGTFNDRSVAEGLAAAVSEADGRVEIKVSEIDG